MKVPMNYICLTIFTFSMSTCLAAGGGAIFNYYNHEGGIVVLISSIFYSDVLLSLMIYVYSIKTKSKFTFTRI